MEKTNLVLIGMAGAGKSTIGVGLAEKLRLAHIDADDLIERLEKKSFQKIIDSVGDEQARRIEERYLVDLSFSRDSVIVTSGSAVYSDEAMRLFKKNSALIFLDLPFEIIESRLVDKHARGIIGFKTKTLKQLYDERKPLYEKYADITISLLGHEKIEEVVERIINNI